MRPSCFDLRLNRPAFVLTALRVLGEQHVRAGLREAERDRPSDALRRAGHDAALSCRPKLE